MWRPPAGGGWGVGVGVGWQRRPAHAAELAWRRSSLQPQAGWQGRRLPRCPARPLGTPSSGPAARRPGSPGRRTNADVLVHHLVRARHGGQVEQRLAHAHEHHVAHALAKLLLHRQHLRGASSQFSVACRGAIRGTPKTSPQRWPPRRQLARRPQGGARGEGPGVGCIPCAMRCSPLGGSVARLRLRRLPGPQSRAPPNCAQSRPCRSRRNCIAWGSRPAGGGAGRALC